MNFYRNSEGKLEAVFTKKSGEKFTFQAADDEISHIDGEIWLSKSALIRLARMLKTQKAQVIDFFKERLKRDANLFQVIKIDDEGNLEAKNCNGQVILIDWLEWANISVFQNKIGQNPFWPKCEKSDFSDDFDNMTEEQKAKIKAWDMQRIIRYNPQQTQYEIIA